MDAILSLVETLNQYLWNYLLLAALVGTGVYFTIRLGFVQVRKLGQGLKFTLGGLTLRGEKADHQGMSSFQALATAVAGQVGTGTIAGAATAIVSGGPGAVFWMWVSAFFGMATNYAEAVLAQKFRTTDENGKAVGGPAYYIRAAFPNRFGKVLAGFFSAALILALGFMGNMVQSNSISDAMYNAFGAPKIVVGVAVALVAGFIFLGGVQRIVSVTEKLVPVMALLYIGGGAAVILGNLPRLPDALTLMLRCAFAPEAALGGALGTITRRSAIRWGIARGVFSNEAGLGSAAMTAACADTESPVRQGLISMTGVFFDTTVICTVTGLAICCSGVLGLPDAHGEALTGAALTIRAFGTVLGPWAGWLVSVSLGLFAFTSVLGCAVQAETVVSFLLGRAAVPPCRVLYGLAVLGGAVLPMETVLQLADLSNALMALPNLACLILLSGEVAADCRKFRPEK